MISARTEDQDKIEALDAGADDYLTKPFSVEGAAGKASFHPFRRISYMQSGAGEISTVFVNGDLKSIFAAAAAYMGEQELHIVSHRIQASL